jgi:hypothetical protein
MRRRLIKGACGLCAAVAALLLGLTGCERQVQKKQNPYVKRLDTPDWCQPGALLVRNGSQDGTILLLRRRTLDEMYVELFGHEYDGGLPQREDDVIYRYDPSKEGLEKVGQDVWDAAPADWGQVYDVQGPRRVSERYETHLRTNALMFKGGEVATTGNSMIYIAKSLTSNKIMVLTTVVKDPSGWGFGSSIKKEYIGSYFHDVLDAETGELISKRMVEVPIDKGMGFVTGLWTWGDKYVVYADPNLCYVCIIDMSKVQMKE